MRAVAAEVDDGTRPLPSPSRAGLVAAHASVPMRAERGFDDLRDIGDDDDDEEEEDDDDDSDDDEDDGDGDEISNWACGGRSPPSGSSDWSLVSGAGGAAGASQASPPLPELEGEEEEEDDEDDEEGIGMKDLPAERLSLSNLDAIAAGLRAYNQEGGIRAPSTPAVPSGYAATAAVEVVHGGGGASGASAAGGSLPSPARYATDVEGPSSARRSLGFTRDMLLEKLEQLENDITTKEAAQGTTATRAATRAAHASFDAAAAEHRATERRRDDSNPGSPSKGEGRRVDSNPGSPTKGDGIFSGPLMSAIRMDATRQAELTRRREAEENVAAARHGFAAGARAEPLVGNPDEGLRPEEHATSRPAADNDDDDDDDDDDREAASRQTAALNASLLASLKASLDMVGDDYLPAGMMRGAAPVFIDSDDDSLD